MVLIAHGGPGGYDQALVPGELFRKNGYKVIAPSRPGQWLMGYFFKHFPSSVVKSFLQTESTLEKHDLGRRVKEFVGDANKFALIDAMFRTMS